jgi:hypothetical protein
MNEEYFGEYDSYFKCSKCGRSWYQLVVGHGICQPCNNVVWPMRIPEGCLKIVREVAL